jgi:flagellar biosynthesis protein FliQ
MLLENIQLEPDEEVLLLVRRHWFYLVLHCVPPLLAALIPALCVLLLASVPQLYTEFISLFIPHILFLYCVWLLAIWMMLASVWTDYYLDMWCVTSRRIVKIDQVALFRRKTGSFRLERMQDVNVEVRGILATLLGYGTVHVQTASADLEEFKADFLPNPESIKATILKAGDGVLDTVRESQ